MCRAGGMRIYSGQTCGEILPTRGYCNGREDWYELFLGLVLFTLVALLFSQEWWDHIWYGVLGSLAV
jgi:hypothetical protein